MAANDMLGQLLNAVGLSNQQIASNSETVKSILDDQQQAQQDMVVQAAKMGDGQGNTVVTQQAEELARLNAQQQSRRFASSLGSNMDDSSEIMTSLASQWKEATVDANAKRTELAGKMNQKFIDNPFNWIQNQMTMGDDIRHADAASARVSQLENELNFAQSQTQNIEKTNNAIAEVRTAATVQSRLEATQAAINLSVDKVKIANASTNIHGIQALNSMTMERVNTLAAGNNAIMQQKHLDLAQAQFGLHKQQVELMIQDRTERLEQKRLDREELDGLADVVRKGASILGFTEEAAMPTAKVIQMLNMKADGYQNFLRVGLRSGSSPMPIISDNAGEAIKMVTETNAPLGPGQDSIKKLMQTSFSAARNPTGVAKYDVTKLDQVANAAGQLAVQTANAQMANITSDASNIYAPPPLKSIASLGPVQGTQLYAKVLAPQMVTGGLKEFNPEQIMSLTAAAIKSGDIDYSTATSDLRGLFDVAKKQNNILHNYPGLGLPMQSGYRTKIDNGFGFLVDRDFTKQVDVDTVLNSKLRNWNMDDYAPAKNTMSNSLTMAGRF